MPPGKKIAKKSNKKKTTSKRAATAEGGSPGGHIGGALLRDEGRRVFLAIGKTVNVGNFESVRVDYGESAIVNPGEDAEEVREGLKRTVSSEFEKILEVVEETFAD